MDDKKRIAKNVIYIYIGVILSTLMSLVTVPLLLKNLGASDYGIFNLVAGVITMLSFFRGSMIIAIQRFMNVAYGENKLDKVNRIFTVGLVLFFAVAILITLIVELLGPFISNGYLNIPSNRVVASTLLFQVLVISTFVTTVGVPYDALFNVHEDMGFFSFFNTFDAFLRLVLAYALGFVASWDKLVFYAVSLVVISIVIFVIKYFVCKRKYKNIKLVKLSKEDISTAKDILSFIGWNLYSALAKIFSTQGYAVVLNLFMGTTINAAYGIANQINSAIQHFTSSVEKAFNPQIMKSEGMKDDNRMISLSLLSTKYSSLIYSFFAIPLLATISFIFEIWLKTPPEYTETFSKIIITASVVSMLSLGLAPMLYAKGSIKQYLFTYGTLLILVVFVAFGLLKIGMSVTFAVSLLILLECVIFGVRLYFCKKLVGLNIMDYFKTVFIPYVKVAIPTFLIIALLNDDNLLNSIIVLVVSVIVFFLSAYFFGLNKQEQSVIIGVIKRIKLRYK
ncbi:MAG: oligosaccharide flippase family protein [Bacteroidales bacterium]|nr:oligosaccharide flippase family protein [Bacteroidales bacterium]